MSDFDSRARRAAAAVRRQLSETSPDTGLRRAQRSPGRAALPAAVAASVLIGAVVVAFPQAGGDATAPQAGGAVAAAGTLQQFDTCDTVLQHFKDHASDYLIKRAVGDQGQFGRTASAESAGAPAAARASAPAHSTTNVQEAGIDEPDIVKTDGNAIVAVARARVHLVDADHGRMKLRKTLPDTGVRNVFLAGDRLLVFGGRESWSNESDWRSPQQRSVLAMYDISDLADPSLVATLTVEGEVLDARLSGTQVRVVTKSTPEVDAPSPEYANNGDLTQTSKLRLREAVARSTVDDWIPAYALRDGANRQVSKGRLVECAQLARPDVMSGLDTVGVFSFDIESALGSRTTVGVIAGGQQIYASNTSTYVSTTAWNSEDSSATTNLHKFVTGRSGTITYAGSGAVPGTLLNSYAMSEYDGVLRVASTVSERRGWFNAREITEGVVTTLHERNGALRQLGQVGGLGREDNESIQAVRFIENRGYVVTFRQTDPLYVLDLRDAAAPKVLGELKIPGYSGYLHPLGKKLLLGVGQSGAEQTPGGEAGVQFSLFDISDAGDPRRIDKQTYGGGAAAAEFDPKAFLHWKPRDLVIAPTSLYGDRRGKGAFSGVVLLRATEKGLTELGRLATTDAHGTVNRSLVIGDTVYLLSDQALQANDLDTHRQIDKLDF